MILAPSSVRSRVPLAEAALKNVAASEREIKTVGDGGERGEESIVIAQWVENV